MGWPSPGLGTGSAILILLRLFWRIGVQKAEFRRDFKMTQGIGRETPNIDEHTF